MHDPKLELLKDWYDLVGDVATRQEEDEKIPRVATGPEIGRR
jgi:hypothetical protein